MSKGKAPAPNIDYLDPGDQLAIRTHVPNPRLKAASLTPAERKEQKARRDGTLSVLHFDMEEWYASTRAKAEELAQVHDKSSQQLLEMFFTCAPRSVQTKERKVNL